MSLGHIRRLLIRSIAASALCGAVGLASACNIQTWMPPRTRSRNLIRVLVPIFEGAAGGDNGAVAAERASASMRNGASTSGVGELQVERIPVLWPSSGQPGALALTPVGEVVAAVTAAGSVPDLLYVQPAHGAPLTPVWDAQSMVIHRLLTPLTALVGLEGNGCAWPISCQLR